MSGLIFKTTKQSILTLKKIGVPFINHFYYKLNDEDNQEVIFDENEEFSWTLKSSDVLSLSGNVAKLSENQENYYQFITQGNGLIKVEGNLKSLINEATTVRQYTFFRLFKDCKNLVDISDLNMCIKDWENGGLQDIPYVFAEMFKGCTNIKTTPKVLKDLYTHGEYSCKEMFAGCTSLQNIENFYYNQQHQTGLAPYCYQGLFSGCTSLTNIPQNFFNNSSWPLYQGCYMNMFAECSSLTSVPQLPATSLAEKCYAHMFEKCKKLAFISEDLLPATTLAPNCYNEMFRWCESLTSAPILPANTLTQGCYFGMFQNCKSLKNIPILPATGLANICYTYMFENCNSITDLSEYDLPATELTSGCYECMFQNCINLTVAPQLRATTLAPNCYKDMFNGCSKLSSMYIDTCICDTQHVEDRDEVHYNIYIKDWLKNTATVGVFYGLKDCYENIYSEIPSGWDFRDITPLTIIAGENTKNLNIKVENTKELKPTTIQYKFEGEKDWTIIPTTGIILETNDVVNFRNMQESFSKNNASFYRFNITGVGDISLSGTIRALNSFNSENIKPFQFTRLFEGNDNIVSVSGLDFQFKKLQKNCYARMFANCINLENIPVLKAEKLAQKCYKEMFQGCNSITGAIIMNEKVLKPYCYQKMFEGCEWIASADLSKAQEISLGCYRDMFYKCTNLTDITVNFNNWKSFKSTDLWLTDTAYFGNFTKPQELSQKDDSKIPQSWKPFVTIKEYDDYWEEDDKQPDFTKHKTLVKPTEQSDDIEP